MNLIQCAGPKSLNRSEVELVLPKGKMGARHNPIPFSDRINYITQSLIKHDLKIVNEAFTVTGKGSKIFGLMELENLFEGYSTMLAFNGSYDQTLSFHLTFGDGVGICTNLDIWGEFKIQTKQTTFIRDRLPMAIDNVVKQLPAKMLERHEVIKSYQRTQLTGRQGDAAITEMVRREIILPSNVGKVIREWDTPKHVEHTAHNQDGTRSLYQLQQAITEAMKPENGRSVLPAAMERTPDMNKYLDYIVKRLSA